MLPTDTDQPSKVKCSPVVRGGRSITVPGATEVLPVGSAGEKVPGAVVLLARGDYAGTPAR